MPEIVIAISSQLQFPCSICPFHAPPSWPDAVRGIIPRAFVDLRIRAPSGDHLNPIMARQGGGKEALPALSEPILLVLALATDQLVMLKLNAEQV